MAGRYEERVKTLSVAATGGTVTDQMIAMGPLENWALWIYSPVSVQWAISLTDQSTGALRGTTVPTWTATAVYAVPTPVWTYNVAPIPRRYAPLLTLTNASGSIINVEVTWVALSRNNLV
jgi:hypothetical protein